MRKRFSILLLTAVGLWMQLSVLAQQKSYSGIYPNLAMYNNEGECGTGAVVNWNDQLYVVTYGPHLPLGSSDKLYIVDKNKDIQVYDHSVGGTPANRMIHQESKQLFIGPYIVDEHNQISVIDPMRMPGRLTGMARHLTDPKNKVYYATMEEGFYSYDLTTKQVTELYTDVNLKSPSYQAKLPSNKQNAKQKFADLFGVHGKGAYSGQGVLVYSNNGEAGDLALKQYDIPSGSLSEWDGQQWKMVRRNQFVEVSGPGGIYGNKHPSDPIWATGWDHKSVILGIRDQTVGWKFYRLPKASRSYDGAHGWNTEWPRIRSIDDGSSDYLMTMHGMFWRFPGSMAVGNTKNIRPRSAYLKVIGDFTRWNDQLVFGCDDSAQKEFLNTRKIKGNLQGAGQSHSNLWFLKDQQLDELGATTAEGALWIKEEVAAGLTSEPFLIAGWEKRNLWFKNHNSFPIELVLEIDKTGNDQWTTYQTIKLDAQQSLHQAIGQDLQAEWIRVGVTKKGKYSVLFSFAGEQLAKEDPALFTQLATGQEPSYLGGYLYALGNNQRKMGILAGDINKHKFEPKGYYELDEHMELKKSDQMENQQIITDHFEIPKDLVQVDENSVLVVDDLGRRWRFPKGDSKFDALTKNGLSRLAREVVTERDLLNLHGTFYELPAENADGFAKVRPIASHQLTVHDFASYRGLLVLSGIEKQGQQEHIIRSKDGNAAVWVGAIDDLWKLGKPTGHGGPWWATSVEADVPSDPYLFGFYDKKTMMLSHDHKSPVTFQIEMDPSGNGEWVNYKKVTVAVGENLTYTFPKETEARWIRFSANKPCKASAILNYE